MSVSAVSSSPAGRRRLAIAVFLKNPRILLLDEATSALDNRRDFGRPEPGQTGEGRTTLTIAHRLTTIKNADRILVLGKDGVERQP